LRALYHGSSPVAVRFRLAVLIVDLAIVAFFIAAPLLRGEGLIFYIWRRGPRPIPISVTG